MVANHEQAPQWDPLSGCGSRNLPVDSMKVPLLDLAPQLEALRQEIIEAVTEVIDSTRYILGPVVSDFEEKVAAYCESRFAVGVSSGTDALVMTLMALDIGPGDRVVTTPYTFFATMGAILRVGAEPLFVDIDLESFNLDPESLAAILEKECRGQHRVRAVLPVHLFGQCADMAPVLALARQYDLDVVEDAAQAIGACCPVEENGGKVTWAKAGSMGRVGCFSFFPSKNLGGIGDGGLVTTSDEELLDVLRSCRNHGAKPKYYHQRVGGNFRLDPIQAAVLAIKLRHLDQWHQQRRRNAALYREMMREAGLAGDPVILPGEFFAQRVGSETVHHHIYNQFTIRVPQRDKLRAWLQEHDIGCEIYYPLCLHQQKCVRRYNDLIFPRAEQAAREALSLPIYPGLSREQIGYVVETIARFYSRH